MQNSKREKDLILLIKNPAQENLNETAANYIKILMINGLQEKDLQEKIQKGLSSSL